MNSVGRSYKDHIKSLHMGDSIICAPQIKSNNLQAINQNVFLFYKSFLMRNITVRQHEFNHLTNRSNPPKIKNTFTEFLSTLKKYLHSINNQGNRVEL